jgi:hypothetical protein
MVAPHCANSSTAASPMPHEPAGDEDGFADEVG